MVPVEKRLIRLSVMDLMDIITNHMKEVFLALVGIRLGMITIRT